MLLLAALVQATSSPPPPRASGTPPPAMAAPAGARPVAPHPAVARPATPARRDPAAVLSAVRAEWSRYDTARRGRLGPLEFATWVLAANGAHVAAPGNPRAPGVKPVSAMNATARAFAAADADHDGGVTPEEMARFLAR